MKKIGLVLSVVLVFTLLLSGCSRPPTEEMEKAQDAVTRAENNADAVNYAANTLLLARQALVNMQNEADSKRYESAKNYAEEAISLAAKAEEDGRAGALRARDEAATLVNSLESQLAETANALRTAAQDTSLDLNVNALSSQLDSARSIYGDARRDLQANNYRDAITRGQTVRSMLSDINAQINNAAQVVARKK
uniref:DUF4398 domain-containing protein n=1 Tax=uncultured bacterium contig00021 TaxID=1181511 RepID=A0A806K2S4_9BACT|nr:hypothetical protein [uncultured bacterium contig00021]